MNEITVISSDNSDRVQTREQKEILYQEISNDTGIPYYYFNSILKLEDESIANESFEYEPDMLPLLIRKILAFGNIIPIIEDTNSEPGQKHNLENKVQLLNPQKVIKIGNLENFLNGINLSYIKEENESIDVVGFVIDLDKQLINYFLDKGTTNTMNLISRIQNGNYTESYLWNKLFVLNNINENFIINGIKLVRNKNYVSLIFDKPTNNDKSDHKMIVCKKLFNYLLYLTKHHYDFVDIYLNLALKSDHGKHSPLFNIISENLKLEETVVSIEKEEKLSKKLEYIKKFFDDVEKNYPNTGIYSYKYPSSIWYDSMLDNFLIVLEKLFIIYENENNEQTKQYEKDINDILEKKMINLIAAAYSRKQEKDHLKNVLQEMKYRWFYIKRFGFEKYRNLMNIMPKYGIVKSSIPGTKGNILNYISESDKKMILSELKNYEKITEYDAPWIKIVRNLRNSYGKEKSKYYKELLKYLPSSIPDNDWIRDEDGYPIICPHLKEKIELELEDKNESDIRDKILEYADELIDKSYFCKICGEVLADVEMEGIAIEGDQIPYLHSLDETLRNYIWKLVSQVVRSNIQFKKLVSNKYINDFVSNITSNLYNLIYGLEKKISKAKTSSLEEIEDKKKLFSVIYIYAVLIKLVFDNPNDIGFIGYNRPQSIDSLMKYSIDRILLTQNIIINKTNTSIEFIRDSVKKAYSNINERIGKTKVEEISASEDYPELDPINIDIVRMNSVHDMMEKKMKTNDVSATLLFEKYINSLKMNKIEPIEFSKKYTEAFDKLVKMDLKDLNEWDKDNLVNDLFSGYYIESYNLLIKYLKSNIYSEPVYENNKFNPNLEKFLHDIEPIKHAENILKDIKKYFQINAFSKTPFKHDNTYKSTGADLNKILSRIYGEKINDKFDVKLLPESILKKVSKNNKFHIHNWKIYVYVDLQHYKSNNIHDYKPEQLVYIHSGSDNKLRDLENFKFIDFICDVCLFNLESVNENINAVIEREQTLINFYNYYENRCPKTKSIHEFKNEICEKCGFNKKMYFSKDKEYFEKYKNIFYVSTGINQIHKKNKEPDEKSYSDSEQETNKPKFLPKGKLSKMPSAEEILMEDKPKTIEWKFNNNIVNEFVAKTYDLLNKGSELKDSMISGMKIKKTEYTNMILNIGLSEKSNYENIMNGSENPYTIEDKNMYDIRINKLDIYIKEIIFNNSILINHKNLAFVPPEIKLILDQTSKSFAKLENPLSDYFDKYKKIKLLFQNNTKEIANFLLEYLLKGLIINMDYFNKNIDKKTSDEFSIYLINNIINMEKVSSNLKEAKAAAIEAMQSTEDIVPDHDQSRMYDDLVKGKKDKYSFEGVDMDAPELDSGNYNSDL